MAKRKKRAKVQPKKRAKPRRAAVRGKARKVSKSARGTAMKPTVAGAKSRRAARKKAVRKKEQGMKPPGPDLETVVVDVIEEPAPGVITVTGIEETQILAGAGRTGGVLKRSVYRLQTIKPKPKLRCGCLRLPVWLRNARAPFSLLWPT